MIRLAWLTDIHLNFVGPADVDALCRAVADTGADAVLIGGDISEAPSLLPHLRVLQAALARPIYFVLGNHDFYWGSIRGVRAEVSGVCARERWLTWLSEADPVALSRTTGLLGHDSWADGRLGRGADSTVSLNDYRLIEEFDGLDVAGRFEKLRALAEEAVTHFKRTLPRALGRFSRLILLTHVPPFRDACWHEGGISNDDFLPHFTCSAVGDFLLDTMRARPDRDLTVLCGHTHGTGTVEMLPNLRVWTGGATYGKPELQRVIVVV